MVREIFAAALGLIVAMVWHSPAHAQNFTVSTIAMADYGNIAAASNGQTVFRADAASGGVIRLSGSGTRLSGASVRSLVTVACNGPATCDSANALITIAPTGTATGRAAPLQNFTVSNSGATASIVVAPGTGSSISFTIGPVGRNLSKTFWVGFDLPIDGNNSAGATGTANSSFAVTVARVDGKGATSLAGAASAAVYRALAISNTSDLAFGRVSAPTSGTGTVTLMPATGAVTVTGNGVKALSAPSSTAAAFTISGEGGQSVSVSVPSTFTMSGPTGGFTVTTNSTISGAQVLSGMLGSGGSLPLNVGGSFNLSAATPAGNYSGSFAVTVQYN